MGGAAKLRAQARIAGKFHQRSCGGLRIAQWNQDALLAVAHQIATAGRISCHDRPAAGRSLYQAARHTFAIPGEQHRDMMRAPYLGDVGSGAVPVNARLTRPSAQIVLAARTPVRWIWSAIKIEFDRRA